MSDMDCQVITDRLQEYYQHVKNDTLIAKIYGIYEFSSPTQ